MPSIMKRLLFLYYVMMAMNTLVDSARCPACTKPENDQRVCGTDGKTYASICYLGRKICKGESQYLAVAYSGKCVESIIIEASTTLIPIKDSIPVTMHKPVEPDYTSKGIVVEDLHCSVTLEPVCGSDGITYPSPCFIAKFATLHGKNDLVIARMGFCDLCDVQPEPKINPNLPPTSKPEPQPEYEPEPNIVTTSEQPTTSEATTKPLVTTIPATTTRKKRSTRKPRPNRRRKTQQSSSKTTTTIQPTRGLANLAPNFGSDVWTQPREDPEPTVDGEPSVAKTESPDSESSFGMGIDLNLGFGGSDRWFAPKPDPIEPRDSVTKTVEPTVKPKQPEDWDSLGTDLLGGSDGFDGSFVPYPAPGLQPEPEPTTTRPVPPTTQAPRGFYYGKLIGRLEPFENRRASHGTQGTVYAIDRSTIRIVNFTYDGKAPDTFFWAGSTREPDDTGEIIPDENERKRKLKSYENQDIILTLPKDRTLEDYTWIAVWCRRFRENFANVYIPDDFRIPSEYELGVLGFKPRINNVRSPSVVIVDTKTIRFISITYDGAATDAFFWIGSGTPDASGISVPYIHGSLGGLLPKLRRDTITVELPDDVTVFDIDYIGVWSKITQLDFGHVVIPARGVLNIPPFIETVTKTTTELTEIKTEPPVRNSETLSTNYKVSWTVDGDAIEFELSARLQDGSYMAFGISGSRRRSAMFGSDVAVAWMDGDRPRVDDYYLGGYSHCSGGSGACKDESFNLPGVNDYTDVVGFTINGVTTITYRRKLNTGDALDMTISLTEAMYIVWAMGSINDDGLVNKHIDIGGDSFSFGRDPVDNGHSLYMSEQIGSENSTSWPEIEILGREVTTFDAKIGPTGGHNRYAAMTGNTEWGFAWYLNEKLAPKLILQRGVEYTFRVFGGDDEALIAQYHPFYITDEETGVNPASNIFRYQTIYAGPTVGGYCEYSNKKQGRSKQSETFDEYFKTLKEKCNRRVLPGVLTWTPDVNTPDTVYYQCYTHQYFGWKIEVVDTFQ